MYKNILIIGPPRCGKTTLAKGIISNNEGNWLLLEDNYDYYSELHKELHNNKNLKLNVIIITQSFFKVNPSIRKNIDTVYIYKNMSNKEDIYDKLGCKPNGNIANDKFEECNF